MGERESLLLVLALIYAGECAFWLGRNDVLFTTWLGADWRCAVGGPLLSNDRGGFRLAPVLPPLGTALVQRLPSLSLSPDGVLAWSGISLHPQGRPMQSGRFVRWNDLRLIELEGARVLLNGALFIKAPTSLHARRLAAQLEDLRKQPRDRRETSLGAALRASFDTAVVSERLAQAARPMQRLRWLGNALFASLFIGLPVVMFRAGLASWWPVVGLALLAQTVTMAILFTRAHRALHGTADDADRFTQALTMLLAPPAAVRAHDCLSMSLLHDTHPLAVAKALCAPDEFRTFARQILADLTLPRLPLFASADPDAVATEQWWRAAMLGEVNTFIRGAGLDPAALLAAPVRAEPGLRSYCPRCGAQFVMAAGVCADCGGRALVAFEPGPDASPAAK
jgi:hypothetical protein